MIEEVARHYGYESVARTLPLVPRRRRGPHAPDRRNAAVIRDILCGLSINEAMTSPLLGPGDHAAVGLPEDELIRADKPLVLEESVLRVVVAAGPAAVDLAQRAPPCRRGAAVRNRPGLASAPSEPPAELDAHRPTRRPVRPAACPHETDRLAVALWPADAYAAADVWTVLADALRLGKAGDLALAPTRRTGCTPLARRSR